MMSMSIKIVGVAFMWSNMGNHIRWDEWRARAREKFLELLGAFPDRVDLDAEVEYSVRDGDLVRERVVFDSEEFASVPCVVLRPATMRPDGSNPAIICCNGHPVSS